MSQAEYMTVKELAAAWPIGADPVKTWQHWVKDWLQAQQMYAPAHCGFTRIPNCDSPVRTYSVKMVLRLVYNEGRDYHAPLLKQEFHKLYAPQIRSLFSLPNAPAKPLSDSK